MDLDLAFGRGSPSLNIGHGLLMEAGSSGGSAARARRVTGECQSGDMCSDMTLSERIGVGEAGRSGCWVRRQ